MKNKDFFCKLGIHTKVIYEPLYFEQSGMQFFKEHKICKKCNKKVGEKYYINMLPKGSECGDWRAISMLEIYKLYGE